MRKDGLQNLTPSWSILKVRESGEGREPLAWEACVKGWWSGGGRHYKRKKNCEDPHDMGSCGEP